MHGLDDLGGHGFAQAWRPICAEAMEDQILANSGMPFSDLMGVEIVERTKERVLGRLTVRDDLCTAGGILHGGAYMAFADALGAIGGVMNLPEGARTTTLESKTNFLGSA